MQKYTVSEIVQKFAVPESKVRRRIKKGLLPVVKERDGHQEVTKVLVESEEMLLTVIEGRDIQGKLYEPETTIEAEYVSDIQEAEEPDVAINPSDSHFRSDMSIHEILKDLYNHNKTLTEDVKKYAELAGQAKLLTDSEHKTKQQFFELVAENAVLKEKLERLERRSLVYWVKKL
jgi:hypothetical protein